MLPKVLSYNCVTFRNAICMWGYYNDLLGEGGGGGARGKVADLWFMATRNCGELLP